MQSETSSFYFNRRSDKTVDCEQGYQIFWPIFLEREKYAILNNDGSFEIL